MMQVCGDCGSLHKLLPVCQPTRVWGTFFHRPIRGHRVHIFNRDETGLVCTPNPYQPGLILPSWWNVRQRAAVATLCTLCQRPCMVCTQYGRERYCRYKSEPPRTLQEDWERVITCWRERWGRGRARSRIIRPKESRVSYCVNGEHA